MKCCARAKSIHVRRPREQILETMLPAQTANQPIMLQKRRVNPCRKEGVTEVPDEKMLSQGKPSNRMVVYLKPGVHQMLKNKHSKWSDRTGDESRRLLLPRSIHQRHFQDCHCS